ncbi:MAG: MarR family winged helix-turn-helix transcriptional regulator [Actinomycetota bacterium]|jgi:DNA-binding MarR family transcriptional regulator
MATPSTRTGTNEEIADLLRDVARELREQVARKGEAEGFPRFSRRLPVVKEVLLDPGITVNELARRTRMAKSQVSMIAGALVEEGVLRREADAADQRLVRLFLTKEGTARTDRWRASYQEMLRSLVKKLSAEESEQLLTGLRALERALSRDGRDVEEAGR